jgi:DNA-binding transcriptional regulator YiaG
VRAHWKLPPWKIARIRKARAVRARLTDKAIARDLGISIYTVKKWGRS